VLIQHVRLERTRHLGPALLGLALWHQLRLNEFFAARLDDAAADVPWSRIAAVLAINRLCAPGSELAIEERWYPTTALDDLLHIPEGAINDSRLYRTRFCQARPTGLSAWRRAGWTVPRPSSSADEPWWSSR